MATTQEDRKYLNDMERKSASLVKTIDATDGYAAGDIVLLGIMPADCLVTDIRIITEGDALDTTFDLNMLADFPEVTPTVIAAAIQPVANTTAVIDMPVTGNVIAAGTAYSGDRGSIWSGPNGINLGVSFVGAATTGVSHIVLTFSYYGTKHGEYGLASVPMQPSRV